MHISGTGPAGAFLADPAGMYAAQARTAVRVSPNHHRNIAGCLYKDHQLHALRTEHGRWPSLLHGASFATGSHRPVARGKLPGWNGQTGTGNGTAAADEACRISDVSDVDPGGSAEEPAPFGARSLPLALTGARRLPIPGGRGRKPMASALGGGGGDGHGALGRVRDGRGVQCVGPAAALAPRSSAFSGKLGAEPKQGSGWVGGTACWCAAAAREAQERCVLAWLGSLIFKTPTSSACSTCKTRT